MNTRLIELPNAKQYLMNKNITRLYSIAAKQKRLIVGLMSGTSLDGLDVALCRFTGSGLHTAMELLEFKTVVYGDEYKTAVQSVFSKRQVDLESVCILNEWVACEHARHVTHCLTKWNIEPGSIDAIASHGQTIYHAPQSYHQKPGFPNATLQIGDGDHLAVKTGIITISNFRQKHIAAGGEGAPLAVYGDYLLFAKPGENRIMLNIGGIANFTWLPGAAGLPVFSTDTGPGNTLMDAYMRQNFEGRHFDADAAVAMQGVIDQHLLSALKDHSFFKTNFPKTTGPELFNLEYVATAAQHADVSLINHAGVMATLNRFTAETIALAITETTGAQPATIYTSGGGMHNPLLMQNLQELLPAFSFDTTGVLQLNPDAKEAVLFAVLANETIAGGEIQVPGNPLVSMGKISFPD